MKAEILVGDCRQRLAELPDSSVHVCVTSPPYFGLRCYGTEPQVWGGVLGCCHSWGTMSRVGLTGGGNQGRKSACPTWATNRTVPESHYGVCAKCGAWYGELGAEPTVAMYVAHMVEVFRHVWRVLRPDGTLWLNLGDSYTRNPAKGQHKPGDSGKEAYLYDKGGGRAAAAAVDLPEKNLLGVPWRLAFALQEDGWILRRDVVWQKPNAKPESVKDRPTTEHEYVFMLAKSPGYYYDADAIREPNSEESLARVTRGRSAGHKWEDGPGGQTIDNDLTHACHPNGRNKRSVWRVNSPAYKGAHFATFPPDLVTPMILASTSERGCCPHCGACWERITKKGEAHLEWQQRCGGDKRGAYLGKATKEYSRSRAEDPSAVKARILAGMRERRTVGWRPTCGCPRHEPVPCVCLDPFGGSGTVGAVATSLGRRSILVELNPEYVKLAETRNQQHGLEL